MEQVHSVSYMPPVPVSPRAPVGDWERKCWGWTRPIFRSSTCSAHELKTLPGWQCSRHHQEHRSNRFVVISGLIGVAVETPFGTARHLLHPGQVMDVHPLNWHYFQSFEASLMMEMYFAQDGSEIDEADIVRDYENLGCPIKSLELG